MRIFEGVAIAILALLVVFTGLRTLGQVAPRTPRVSVPLSVRGVFLEPTGSPDNKLSYRFQSDDGQRLDLDCEPLQGGRGLRLNTCLAYLDGRRVGDLAGRHVTVRYVAADYRRSPFSFIDDSARQYILLSVGNGSTLLARNAVWLKAQRR
jgi:hypothetical protein